MRGHLPVICCLPHARERVGAGEPLDVERLAQSLGPHPQDPILRRERAMRIAAEYERLRDEEERYPDD